MSENPFHIDRRGFLITSGMAGAGLVLASPGLFAQTLPPIAVGYWDGSDALTPAALKGKDDVPADAAPLPVATTAAAGLLRPDPLFMKTSARVRVVPHLGGARPAPFSLWVHYQAEGPASTRLAPFGAWSFDGRGQASNPISFVAPVEQDHGILFSIRSEAGLGRRRAVSSDSAVREQFFRFVILPEASEPKLQRGVYFIAPLPGSQAAPNWRAYDYRADESGVRRLYSGTRAVDFGYLELTMEYANPSDEGDLG